jgi:hypothetical protein
MGGSILPTTIYKNKLYFLFGKERAIDENPGWSDFGGGTDKGETYFNTAIREGVEEMTGFLGNENNIKQLLTKYGTYNLDFTSNGNGIYRVHIFPMNYDNLLVHYYNNNQKFLQKKLDPKILKDTKIFEKTQIKWISVDELTKMLPQFRTFYQNIINLILANKTDIDKFIRSAIKGKKNNKTIYKSRRSISKRNKTNKLRKIKK